MLLERVRNDQDAQVTTGKLQATPLGGSSSRVWDIGVHFLEHSMSMYACTYGCTYGCTLALHMF